MLTLLTETWYIAVDAKQHLAKMANKSLVFGKSTGDLFWGGQLLAPQDVLGANQRVLTCPQPGRQEEGGRSYHTHRLCPQRRMAETSNQKLCPVQVSRSMRR